MGKAIDAGVFLAKANAARQHDDGRLKTHSTEKSS
jgi:hypothetical protein